MTHVTGSTVRPAPQRLGEVYLFGIPIGGLGWFATLLIGTAAGFAAFFAGTLAGIVGIAVINGIRHTSLDFAFAYTRVGFPLGVTVLVVALVFLVTLRVRRIGRR